MGDVIKPGPKTMPGTLKSSKISACLACSVHARPNSRISTRIAEVNTPGAGWPYTWRRTPPSIGPTGMPAAQIVKKCPKPHCRTQIDGGRRILHKTLPCSNDKPFDDQVRVVRAGESQQLCKTLAETNPSKHRKKTHKRSTNTRRHLPSRSLRCKV